MIPVKIKITSVGKQWLLSIEDKGSYTKVGKIKPLLNKSAIFLFDDSKSEISIRELENAIVFKIHADNVALKLTLSKDKPTEILNWKSNSDGIELKCHSKSTHYYVIHKGNKIAKMKPITENNFIFEIISPSNFQPMVLLATLYPFF